VNKKTGLWGFTLVEILIVVGILALLSAIAIPNLLRARMSANDALAQTTLKTIGKALETYLVTNTGYPGTVDALTTATPPYLNENYFSGTRAGFTFANDITSGSYTITATPVNLGQSGTTIYTITTGGVLNP